MVVYTYRFSSFIQRSTVDSCNIHIAFGAVPAAPLSSRCLPRKYRGWKRCAAVRREEVEESLFFYCSCIKLLLSSFGHQSIRVKDSLSAVVTPPPFLLSRNMFPCLHPVITVSMAKLQINEWSAKEKLVFLFALPSESNFGAARVTNKWGKWEEKTDFSFVFPSGSNFGAARVTKICSRKVISLRSLPFSSESWRQALEVACCPYLYEEHHAEQEARRILFPLSRKKPIRQRCYETTGQHYCSEQTVWTYTFREFGSLTSL